MMDAAYNPTLADLASRMDKNGKIPKIIEILNETNGIVEDMGWVECNDNTKHKTTLRTRLPAPQAKLFNRGSTPSKSDTTTIEESCIMLEDWAETDADLADKSGNASGYRMTESVAHIQGFNHRLAEIAFYGNANAKPNEEFHGLSPRYNDLTDPQLEDYIIDAGGTGSNNTSIWLVCWGPMSVHGIYPMNSMAGLKHEDKGKDVKDYNDDDGTYRLIDVYRDKWNWDAGLVVRDYRCIVRIANIDVTQLQTDPTTGGPDLYELLGSAQERVRDEAGGRLAIYGNRKVRETLRHQAQNKKNVEISRDQVTGKRIMDVDGIPFRLSDALISNEQQVV